ncbi:MAG TPA: hypothetical protein VK176_11880 [Phycisphaerales bacterium]|nr:hypothetical protein [Phycisphaerales bacterium]
MSMILKIVRNGSLAIVRRVALHMVLSAAVVPGLMCMTSHTARAQERPTQEEPPQNGGNEEVDRLRRRTNAADEAIVPGTTGTPANKPASMPAVQPAKPRTDSSLPVPKVRRAREGIFVIKQRGELLMARTGDVIFVPDKGAPAKTSRPMVLLPCQTLARLENAAGLRSDQPTGENASRPRVLMTGQVMVYRQREYLLPSVFQIESNTQAASSAGSGEPVRSTDVQEKDAAAPAESGVGDEKADSQREGEVESFIRELEDRRTQNRGLTREMARTGTPPAGETTTTENTSEPSTVATQTPDAGKAWPIAEGSVITARRARLVRFTDGSVGVSFDNGAKPSGGGKRTEAPMAMLACQLTQRMEEVVGTRGDKAQIEVSGRVFSYGNRNYLLPTMYQVLPPSDVGPLN